MYKLPSKEIYRKGCFTARDDKTLRLFGVWVWCAERTHTSVLNPLSCTTTVSDL